MQSLKRFIITTFLLMLSLWLPLGFAQQQDIDQHFYGTWVGKLGDDNFQYTFTADHTFTAMLKVDGQYFLPHSGSWEIQGKLLVLKESGTPGFIYYSFDENYQHLTLTYNDDKSFVFDNVSTSDLPTDH